MADNSCALRLVITIDGPAGAGKTTVSKRLAERLGYRYIDTGALYRGIAYAVRQAGVAHDDDVGLESICGRTRLLLKQNELGLRLLLNGDDITDEIRTPDITMMASAVSARPVVRQFLLKTQRDLGKAKRIVIEGRDMGTVVFPEADVKFYLDADQHTRACRRHTELTAKSASAPSLESVEKDMRARDHNDSSRDIAPLKPAPDAVLIDSTRMSADMVVETMLDTLARRFSITF